MQHLRHVRLLSHKGLKGAILTHLGKINVVCGPNNSGKTTVLECISRQNLCILGMEVAEPLAQAIAQQGLKGVNWPVFESISEKYVNAVKNALNKRSVWFADEGQKLIDSGDWKDFAAYGGNPTGHLGQAFVAAFPKFPSITLIPAKRQFLPAKDVDAFEVIEPGGAGALNFLFNAKNQDESAPLRKKFEDIGAAFREISAGYEFDVFLQARNPNARPPPTIVELRFRRRGDSWINEIDCGLGLQDLLIILYFALASESEVILIEEPENHLHPEIQRRLIAFLREKTEKQFFLSTHSSVFLNTQFADRVFTCRMTDAVHVDNATSKAALLTELGYSIADNLVADLVVLCEGPKDKPVLEEFFQKMGLLDRSNIKVWPLGGDIMDQLDLSVFQDAHQLIALIDGDPGSSKIRKRFMEKCEALKIAVTRLERIRVINPVWP